MAYSDEKYKFTGKERDVETGYDYFGARYYDSRIGRWLHVDPLAEKYFGWNPYNYSLNNPVTYFDPDGRQVDDPEKVNAVNILLTTFFDVKHSAENLLLNALYQYGVSQGKFPGGFKYQAGYATDEFGNEIFKTEIKLVPSEGVVGDIVGYGLDVANVSVGGKVGDGASLLAKGVGKNQVTDIAKSYSEATFKSFEKQLLSGGRNRLLKSQATIQKNIEGHLQKLEAAKKVGGYTSSIEREIRTSKSQIDAINDLLK